MPAPDPLEAFFAAYAARFNAALADPPVEDVDARRRNRRAARRARGMRRSRHRQSPSRRPRAVSVGTRATAWMGLAPRSFPGRGRPMNRKRSQLSAPARSDRYCRLAHR